MVVQNAMAMSRIVCPNPRRVRSCTSLTVVTSMRFHGWNDAAAFDSKSGGESLDVILLRKDGLEAEQFASTVPSPPYILQSPPCRAPNPLVKNADFSVGKTTKISSTVCSTTLPTSPSSVKLTSKQTNNCWSYRLWLPKPPCSGYV